MRKTFSKKAGLISAALGSLVVSGAAFAADGAVEQPVEDDAAIESGSIVDDIVVTARRRQERAQDVPISLIAVGTEQLEAANVTSVADLGRVASGLKLQVTNNRRSTVQVIIRGQRQFGNIPGQDPPTAMYFADAIVFPQVGFNTSLHDIASVQVLKGPQGTLFGRNTTGGAVVVTPARPSNDFSAEVTATIGNYATYGYKGYVNLPVNDAFQVRLAGFYLKNGNYQEILTPALRGRGAGGGRTFDLRLSANWQISDNIENYLVAYYADEKNNGVVPRLIAVSPLSQFVGPFGNPLAPPPFNSFPRATSYLYNKGDDPNKVYTDFLPRERVKQYNVIDTLTVTLSDNVTLKNIFAHRHVDGEVMLNTTGTDLPIIPGSQEATYSSISDELQLNATALDNRLNLTAGLYYFRIKSYDRQYGQSFRFSSDGSVVAPASGRITNASYAAYAQATFEIVDDLNFTAGARYTVDKRKILWASRTEDRSVYYDDLGINFVPVCNMTDANGVRFPYDSCFVNAKKTFKEPTWNLSLDYRFSPNLLVYFTNRRGYRSGGYNFRAVSAAQRQPYSAEKVTDFELGFKSDFSLADWNFRLNAAGYYDKYTDLQRSASLIGPLGVAVSSLFNAAKGNAKGLEVEFGVQPTDKISLNVNYAYIKFDYTSFPYFANGALRDFSDRTLAGVPTHSLSVSGSYELPLGDDVGRLVLSGNVSYESGSYYSEIYQSSQQLSVLFTPAQAALLPDSTVPYRAPGYTMTNFRVDWKDFLGRPFDLSFYMKNAFNVRAITQGSPIYETVGAFGGNFAPPRMFGLEVRARFD
jgi:iron complex outermembrane receptor protein